MSDPVELAKVARSHLSSALSALQTNAHVPAELMALADPIAETMGILHKIERTNGEVLERRDVALQHVRSVLDQLQRIGVHHPAIEVVTECVAASLSRVHTLSRYVPPAAPQQAPAAPPQAHSMGAFGATEPVERQSPFLANPQAAAAYAQQVHATQPSAGADMLKTAALPQPSPVTVQHAPPLQPQAHTQPIPAQQAYAQPQPYAQPAQPVHAQPQGYPQPAQPQGYPQAAQPQGYPQAAQPQGYPQAAQPQGYPQAAQPHQAAQPQGYPQAAQPQGYPQPAPQPAYAQPAQQPYVQPAQPRVHPAPHTQPIAQPVPAGPGPDLALPPTRQAQGAAAGAVRRAEPQHPNGIDVELGTHSPSNFYKGLAGNDVIEHGGIFVATYKIPPIGAAVMLRVLLPGDYEFSASAVVQWSREGSTSSDSAEPGFGARFTQISAEGRQLVYRYTRNREPIFYDDL